MPQQTMTDKTAGKIAIRYFVLMVVVLVAAMVWSISSRQPCLKLYCVRPGDPIDVFLSREDSFLLCESQNTERPPEVILLALGFLADGRLLRVVLGRPRRV